MKNNNCLNNKRFKTNLFYLALFCSLITNAQTYQWAKSVGGTSTDAGTSIAVDANGNVYAIGYYAGTADFDPGPGTTNLTSVGVYDIFFAKYDANGNYQWAHNIGGVNSDYGYGITTDASGNVYITGYFQSTVDFDPGPGTATLSATGQDGFFAKYDNSGNYVWAKSIGGTTADNGRNIVVDAQGNVYISGYFSGVADFDPDAGIANLTSAGNADSFFAKYDNNGNYQWAKNIGGPNADYCYGLKLDDTGNIYLTGFFNATADFDPGAGVANQTSAGNKDIYFAKYDNNGNYLWAAGIGSANDDYGYGIDVDINGNVYVTGTFQGSPDFNPGTGTAILTSAGLGDIFLAKYDAAGNYLWAKNMGGTNDDIGYSLSLDGMSKVYVTGNFDGTVDFDPGVGTSTITTNGSADIFIAEYDNNGNYVWAKNIGSSSNDYGNSITVGAAGVFYITGQYGGTADFDPGSGTANLTSVGSTFDVFMAKYYSCISAPAAPGVIYGASTSCFAASEIYSTTSAAGATSYSWSLPGGWSGTSTTNTISVTVGSSGTMSVTANNACGSSSVQTLSVTVNSLPTIIVNSGAICSGNSFTMSPSGASTYTYSSGSAVVSPTANASYSVSGTSTQGCVSASPAVSNITVNALPTISVNSGAICSGNSFTMSPSGASTYTYSSGSSVVSPTANASYSVSGTSTQGCVSASPAVSNVTVNTLPNVSATTSNTLMCTGETATLTASGATSYTFNPGGAGTTIVISPTVTSNYTITGTDANGCSNTSILTQSVSLCTGIQSVSQTIEANIYPNPTNGKLMVNYYENEFKIEVFNSVGELVSLSFGEGRKGEADISQQPSGIYFIRIGTSIKKIIKE